MASGKLGTPQRLSAATDTAIYTVPANTIATANVLVVNCGALAAKVRVGIGTGTSPVDGDWVEYDTTVTPNGVLERTGLVMAAGEKLFVRSDVAGVTARAHGFEEGAA